MRVYQELSTYDFEIRYTPGKENIVCSDYLCRIPSAVIGDDKSETFLPSGAYVPQLTPGGGNSLFVTLSTILTRKTIDNIDENELRERLITTLISGYASFGLQYDKAERKRLKSMLITGVLPSFEALLPFSRLYNTAIYIFFGSTKPLLIRDNKVKTDCIKVFLQCLGGIYFNEVIIENSDIIGSPINYHTFNISSVFSGDNVNRKYKNVEIYCLKTDRNIKVVSVSLLLDCNHKDNFDVACNKSIFAIDVGDINFCALLDTGAETS